MEETSSVLCVPVVFLRVPCGGSASPSCGAASGSPVRHSPSGVSCRVIATGTSCFARLRRATQDERPSAQSAKPWRSRSPRWVRMGRRPSAGTRRVSRRSSSTVAFVRRPRFRQVSSPDERPSSLWGWTMRPSATRFTRPGASSTRRGESLSLLYPSRGQMSQEK